MLDVRGMRLAALSPLESALYEVRWLPRPPADEPAIRGTWLVLSDGTGVGVDLARRLRGIPHVLALAGDTFASEAPGRYRIDPADPAHVARLLAEAFGDGPPERVVHLFALDAPSLDSPEALAGASDACCVSVRHLVAALGERDWRHAPRLFVVTRGSQAAGGSDQVTSPQQALAWGFGTAVAQEHPELHTTLVDLPTTGGLDALWKQLRHADAEAQVALRDTGRLVPRLAPARADHSRLTLAADRSYLVTGGLGGLGRVVADRLAGLGARTLALLGRRAPDDETRRWIDDLGARGVQVHVLQADVADRAALAEVLRGLERQAPPVAGIVHAAGVLDDAVLENLTPERITRVLAPKVLGATALTELLPDTDFVVLFSSAAGLLGSAGQSSYAAANAFLDAWAHHRAEQSLLSLNWGAWSEVGMVAADSARASAAQRWGMGSFRSDEGGALFQRVLGTARRQLAPIALDLGEMARHPELVAARPLLADLVPAVSGGARDLIARVRRAADDEEKARLLQTYLLDAIGRVTGDPAVDIDATTPMKALDLDSLMLVTLRGMIARELGVELSTARLMATPGLRGLAELILPDLPDTDVIEALPLTAREVPEVAWLPVPRDISRLLRTEQQGTPSAAHTIGFAARLATPTTRERLSELLAGIADRHAVLRTAIVAHSDHGHQLEVRRRPAGDLLRWTTATGAPDDVEVQRRLTELLEAPFDLATSGLWRFELLTYPADEQVLVFGAHHAVGDLQSLALVVGELDAGLSGVTLDPAVTNRDLEALLEAQPAVSVAPLTDEDKGLFAGCRRLDLTLAAPRPAERSYRAGGVVLPLPEGLLDEVSAQATGLAITPAAFCLGAFSVLLARLRGRSRFALAVPVDTRMHAGALDALGFFGVPIPFAARVEADEPVVAVLRRTDEQLGRVLEKGATFFDAMSTLIAEGLYEPNAPLIEAYFNYLRPQHRTMRELEILSAGPGHTDLDLMVIVAPDAGQLRLMYNADILDHATGTEIGQGYLDLLAELATGSVAQPATTAVPATIEDVSTEPRLSGSLAVAATFALGDLPALLGGACEMTGVAATAGLTVAEAPYHQVLAGVQDPNGVFAQPSTVAGVVLLRATDLGRFRELTDDLLAEAAEQYRAALGELCDRGGRPLIVGFLPSGDGDDRLARWERELAEHLEDHPGIAVLRPADFGRDHAVGDPLDADTDTLAHLPFHAEYQAAVALTLADTVAAVRCPHPKVIVVDGDDTLWGGVAGELGPDQVELAGPWALMARRLLAWRAAGVLLVLVSNNDEATLRAVLDRPESLLGVDHFSVISAGWEPKSDRIRSAAGQLNLGLDSFLFLDDNPVQIAEVRAELPEVVSVVVPAGAEVSAFVRRLWPATPRAATAEDAVRAEFYQQEAARRQVRERAGFADFLATLELEVDIQPLSSATRERSIQLSRRTNQFTVRPVKLDQQALTRAQRDGEVWTARVRDRFGDYGQVGVLIIRPDNDVLELVAWMLSCRALGRGVEERLLGWLADRAEALGCSKVRLVAERTDRNLPARRLVAELGDADPDSPRLDVLIEPAHLRTFRSWDETGKQDSETCGG